MSLIMILSVLRYFLCIVLFKRNVITKDLTPGVVLATIKPLPYLERTRNEYDGYREQDG
jgi:hypothetical protein